MTEQIEESRITTPPRFVGGKPRSETVPLEWPVEYDGKVWDAITVRRMTVLDIRAFHEQVLASSEDDKARIRFPMFDAPFEVLDALDDDDAQTVNEVVTRFLPRRFRADEGSGPDSTTGGA